MPPTLPPTFIKSPRLYETFIVGPHYSAAHGGLPAMLPGRPAPPVHSPTSMAPDPPYAQSLRARSDYTGLAAPPCGIRGPGALLPAAHTTTRPLLVWANPAQAHPPQRT